MFGVLTVGLALIVGFAPQEGDTTFRLAVPTDFVAAARPSRCRRPRRPGSWSWCARCAPRPRSRCTCGRRSTPLWLVAVFAVAWMTGFLTWAAAGGTVPVVGLLGGSLALAVPLVFGALGGVLGERAGVVNIAIDGQLLFGAFGAAMVGSLVGSAWAGLAGGHGRRPAGRAGARPVRDQLLRRPGDRRRRAQRAGHRPHQLHVQPGAGPQRRDLNTPAAVRAGADPGAGRHPADRPDLLPADRRSSTCSTSPSRWSPGRSTAPSGACGSARSASTRRPPTPSASRSTAPATAPSCWPARSPAWAAPSTRWCRCRSSTAR